MKFIDPSRFADPDTSARELTEIVKP